MPVFDASPLVVSAHQPSYLPWLGLFHKIALSDTFVLFDDVLFDERDFNNRNRIRGPAGPIWLTVPVYSGPGLKLKDARIRDDIPWRRKHLRSIAHAYGRARHAGRYMPFFERTYARQWKMLTDLVQVCLDFVLAELELDVRLVRLSEMGLTSRKSQLVLDVCTRLGARLFLFGESGRDYADEAAFAGAGIRLEFQDYRHPEYPQGRPFQSHLSVIDLLFHCGPDSREVLLSGNLTRDDLRRRHFGGGG